MQLEDEGARELHHWARSLYGPNCAWYVDAQPEGRGVLVYVTPQCGEDVDEDELDQMWHWLLTTLVKWLQRHGYRIME